MEHQQHLLPKASVGRGDWHLHSTPKTAAKAACAVSPTQRMLKHGANIALAHKGFEHAQHTHMG